MRSHNWTQHWHHLSATLRLTIGAIAGLTTYALLTPEITQAARLALSWSAAGGLYLALSYFMMYFSSADNMLTLSKKEDDGAAMILLIIICGAAASLFAIVIILSGLKSLPTALASKYIALVLSTYVISWLFIHTAFALHYAHVYYQEMQKTQEAPLIFAAKLNPSYVDFLYFSIVIGLTCQTADVNIASSRMRFLVMIQGMTAFAFNASLLALAINLISGVVTLN